ncbi:unnamed protein product [Victoria cruziana]
MLIGLLIDWRLLPYYLLVPLFVMLFLKFTHQLFPLRLQLRRGISEVKINLSAAIAAARMLVKGETVLVLTALGYLQN